MSSKLEPTFADNPILKFFDFTFLVTLSFTSFNNILSALISSFSADISALLIISFIKLIFTSFDDIFDLCDNLVSSLLLS